MNTLLVNTFILTGCIGTSVIPATFKVTTGGLRSDGKKHKTVSEKNTNSKKDYRCGSSEALSSIPSTTKNKTFIFFLNKFVHNSSYVSQRLF
jgi:hypothetical protein